MTDAIGPNVSDVARALMEARQTSNRAAAVATREKAATGLTGHEGDSVTLSDAAQEALTVRTRDGIELTPIPLDKLKLITPQGQRSEAETAIKQLMADLRSEEHTSELQSLMRISYAVFCLKKKNKHKKI